MADKKKDKPKKVKKDKSKKKGKPITKTTRPKGGGDI